MMFGYHLDLAWRSLCRSPVLTALMVLAIGLGIGASMTMVTVLHVLSADPAPGRSARLFYPQIDPRNLEGYVDGASPVPVMAWRDAMNLLHAARGRRQAALADGRVTVVPLQGVAHAFNEPALYTTAGFFPMFGVRFIAGDRWTEADGEARARVAVITESLAEKLYGTGHAAGKLLRLGKYDFRVTGVIEGWNPQPHFHYLANGNYAKPEEVFLPLQTARELKLATEGMLQCWGGGMPPADPRDSEDCAWLGFWVQLDTPAQVAAYRGFLVHYSAEQKALGRFERPPNVRLPDLMQWLAINHAVPGTVRLEGWLALGFLLVCLVNTVALLLVKFLRRGGELSVRRAMGASRRVIFTQLLIEAALVGLAGGAVGLLLTTFGLWVVRQQPQEYAALAHLDGAMLAVTFALAVAATLAAALFPAWRACRIQPARLLKTQ